MLDSSARYQYRDLCYRYIAACYCQGYWSSQLIFFCFRPSVLSLLVLFLPISLSLLIFLSPSVRVSPSMILPLSIPHPF